MLHHRLWKVQQIYRNNTNRLLYASDFLFILAQIRYFNYNIRERLVLWMTLKTLLKSMNGETLVSIVDNNFSNGAYSAKELLARANIFLNRRIRDNGITARCEKAKNVVAYDSSLRDEYFYIIQNADVPYLIIEI